VLSLDAGISACNTFRRLDALRETGVLDQTMADDLIEALLLFNRMRLARQLRRLEDSDANKVPANVVNMIHTEDLSSSELALLREALREVRALRNLVAERYSAG
jgi:signal-transduction protein with cAMP-binding, CBS, and nucleotidyltransferase domain